MVDDRLPDRGRRRITEDQSGCWLWTGPPVNGYGQVQYRLDGKRTWLIHRLVWRLLVGDLPEHLHHECRVTLCVNPAHLTATNASEHRTFHLGTTCRAGHAMTPENTYTRRDGGGRQCRACKAQRQRERHAANAQAENQARSERRRRALAHPDDGDDDA